MQSRVSTASYQTTANIFRHSKYSSTEIVSETFGGYIPDRVFHMLGLRRILGHPGI